MGGSIQFAICSHIKHLNAIKVYLLSSIVMIVHYSESLRLEHDQIL